MRSRYLAVGLVVLLAACNPESTGDSAVTTASSMADSIPTSTGSEGTATVPSTTSATTLPPGTEELPEEVRTELAELIDLTEQVRQLEFREQPRIAVVSDEELAQRVRDQLAEDLADLPADEALYELLGLIEDDTDLAQLYTDLYSEQVAGFYDGEVGELVVPVADAGFTAVQRATLVHELNHALTDQHFGFHDRYTEMLDDHRFDAASAYQALIEGDAVLAEVLYLQGLSQEEQGEFFAESFDVESEQFEAAPQFIQDALIFPYNQGFIFVDRLRQTGGLEAIGDAYQDPPASTEQIIDPADFPADMPMPVELAPVEIAGFELEYESTWGELGFALMLDQVLTESASDTAAGGWGGDTYQLFFDGTDVVLVLQYRGDTAQDAEELAATLQDYVETAMEVGEGSELEGGIAFEGADHAWVRADGSDVWFVASSLDTVFADTITGVLPASDEG